MKRNNSKEYFSPISRSLSMLLTNDGSRSPVEFYIPDFQRQYSWKNSNLQELWKDLNEAFRNKEEVYFLGSVVLVKTRANKFSIIDGQQRLTTLVIMMDVLLKDFGEQLDKKVNKEIKKYHGNVFRLQNNPSYDQEFQEEIREKNSFIHETSDLVTEKQLSNSDPRFKYRNTAYFFYDRFKEYDGDINEFLSFVFNNIFVIRTICYDENFAIKMFISLNDRGLPLSNADNFKSWLYSKCEKDQREAFNQQWKKLVDDSNEFGITMDDFIVWYEYYLIRKNPKINVTDVLKSELEQYDCRSIMSELIKYMNCVKKVYKPSENTNLIYSLRYIKWKAYVMSIMASAYKVEYDDIPGLLKLLRKFYYIAWGAGGNVNSVKQTSFNILECIVNKNSIEDIKRQVDNYIYKKNRISNFYDAMDGDVYETDFFKPLLMSVEYEEWEDNSLQFQPLDNKLHIDHIMPKKWAESSDWNYVSNAERATQKLNTIGNMALLQWYKNEKALNKGFRKKLYLYSGFEEDGVTPIEENKGKGSTKFRTTQTIIEEYRDFPQKKWTIKSIDERKVFLMGKIEKMLDIKQNDRNIVFDSKTENVKKGKWKYDGRLFTNRSFVKQLLMDYIINAGIRKFEEIPSDLARFKVYSQDFITKEPSNSVDLRSRYPLEINGMKIYVNGIYRAMDTIALVEEFKRYFDFSCKRIEENEVSKV